MKLLSAIAICCWLVCVSTAPTYNTTAEPPTADVCSDEQLLAEFKKIVDNSAPGIKFLGDIPGYGASSCKQIQELRPASSSGYYWIQENSGPAKVWCEMEEELCGEEGPWMRIAGVNMAEGNGQCPSGLELVTSPQRLCHRYTNNGCSSAYFSNYDVPFKKVCGKVIGYQFYHVDAFFPYYSNQQYTIDDLYVDGVSITYGSNPRQHIWTLAAAYSEVPSSNLFNCPCSNSISHVAYTGLIPEFIGDDYYCETGSRTSAQNRIYLEDPLWDGEGCGRFSTCCDGDLKPWFFKEFLELVNDRVEVRVCANQHRYSSEDVYIEIIELYVQ